MSINAYEQMATGVSDITSIALVALEVIHNTLLINELRLWFACRKLLGNLAARKHWLDNSLELHTEISNVLKKCQKNKFDCLVNEILLIKQLPPCLQSDSIRAEVFG